MGVDQTHQLSRRQLHIFSMEHRRSDLKMERYTISFHEGGRSECDIRA